MRVLATLALALAAGAAGLLPAAGAARAELPVPPLRARVNDLAGVLDPPAAARLETRLEAFERETTHQIAVLTVPSLEGEAIEPFALRVAEAWQLGPAGVDNGILLVVAPGDRRARIEVGYGLEGAVPDAIAKRVLEDVMFPHFRRGDFGAGIEAGAGALMQAARGEQVDVPRSTPPARRGAPHGDPLAVVFFAALLGTVLAAPLRRARPLSSLVGGAASGGLTWLLLASLGWAAAAFVIAFVFGLGGPVGGGRGRRGGHIFLPGGGWGRGGGFGGGGFGGGGGGFGGGGASGSW